MKSIIDITDLTIQELDEVVDTAMDIIANPQKYAHACDGKVLASMFFEASTRTRLSFEAAMHELGGSVISMPDAGLASTTKGESIADTAKIVSCYADIIVMRHPLAGSAYVLAKNASVPIINAGDGGHCHPTQTTADLLTIYRTKVSFDNLTIGLCGDLLYGRTVHSLINAMCRYKNNKFVLISPDELKLPEYVKDTMKAANAPFIETNDLEGAMKDLDILYMTRIQRERFSDPEVYDRLKDSYCLTAEKMKLAKPDMILMHPLPRVNEISVKVDADPRAYYFDEALNGKYMRMALILKLLRENEEEVKKIPHGTTRHFNPDYVPKGVDARINESRCINPKCITQTEQELDQIEVGGRCFFCESDMEG